MKKIKIVSSLSATIALGGGTAFTATSCSKSDSKTDISSLNWVFEKYYKASTVDGIKAIFLKDNDNIFSQYSGLSDNVDISISIANTIVNIDIKTKDGSDKYKGERSQTSQLAENLANHVWNTEGNYVIQMINDQETFIKEFEKNNTNVDFNQCNVTCDLTNYTNWIIYVEPKLDSLNYYYNDGTSSTKATMTIVAPEDEVIQTNNFIETSDGNKYYLPENLDLNTLCGSSSTITFTVPSYKGGIKTSLAKPSIKNIVIQSINDATKLNDYFLYHFKNLTNLSIPEHWNVTSIGNYFLDSCRSLTSFKLPWIEGTISIGSYFMSGCSGVTELEFPLITKVNIIGDHFLQSCSSLTKAELPASWSPTSIGDYFLYGCDSLTEVNLGNTSANVMPTDKYSFATSNKDASCYKNGIKIYFSDMNEENCLAIWDFMDQNSSVDPYRNIAPTFNGILYDNDKFILKDDIDPNLFCTYDDQVFPAALTSRTYPLKQGSATLTIDYSNKTERDSVTNVILSTANAKEGTNLRSYFLSKCECLTNVTFPTTWNIDTIGGNFLSSCVKLTNITLSDKWNVTYVGDWFAAYCDNLTQINMGSILAEKMNGNSPFVSSSKSVPSFNPGITIYGTDRQNFHTKYPDRSDDIPYRKTIVGSY